MSTVPNGWMDQDGTWCGDGVEVGLGLGHIVGPNSASQKGATEPPIFGPFLLWPKGWMHQDATWYGARHQVAS